MPDISRYQRWALTPPLHNRCITAFFFSVARSSPSRALGCPKQTCYFDCPDFPHNSCSHSLSAVALSLFGSRLLLRKSKISTSPWRGSSYQTVRPRQSAVSVLRQSLLSPAFAKCSRTKLIWLKLCNYRPTFLYLHYT